MKEDQVSKSLVQYLAHAKYLININFFLLMTVILILSKTFISWGCPQICKKASRVLSIENSIMVFKNGGEKEKGGGDLEESSYIWAHMSQVFSSKVLIKS